MVYCVISEFNPFHNGHRYLLKSLPSEAEDYTVCIMSGSFVQRGEPARYDKWARAKAAVENGADVVLELPIPFVLSDGDRFGAKGVELAAALGVPVTMAFGAETADLSALERVASASEAQLMPLMKEELAKGCSYGAARQRALEQLFPEESKLLRQPNNLLAAGYLRACLERGIPYRSVLRTAPHDQEPVGETASASYIRAHREEAARFCPVLQSPLLAVDAAERGMMTLLKGRTAEELKKTANISEGLENRILSALEQVSSLQELYDTVKTKRYSHAKLRRAVACGVLGISEELPLAAVPYLRVLAFGEKGRGLLKTLKKTALLPLCQSGKECEEASETFFAAERYAADLWNCWSEEPRPSGEEYRRGAAFLGKKL